MCAIVALVIAQVRHISRLGSSPDARAASQKYLLLTFLVSETWSVCALLHHHLPHDPENKPRQTSENEWHREMRVLNFWIFKSVVPRTIEYIFPGVLCHPAF
jgi:hypothetical protein